MTDQVNAVVERLEGLARVFSQRSENADANGLEIMSDEWASDAGLLRVAAALLRSMAEREGKLTGTLQAIKDSASWQIEFYNKNGPTWTGKDGHEYDDMSASLTRAEEIIQQVNATLERP